MRIMSESCLLMYLSDTLTSAETSYLSLRKSRCGPLTISTLHVRLID